MRRADDDAAFVVDRPHGNAVFVQGAARIEHIDGASLVDFEEVELIASVHGDEVPLVRLFDFDVLVGEVLVLFKRVGEDELFVTIDEKLQHFALIARLKPEDEKTYDEYHQKGVDDEVGQLEIWGFSNGFKGHIKPF